MDLPCERDLGRYCVAFLDEVRHQSGNKLANDSFQCYFDFVLLDQVEQGESNVFVSSLVESCAC